MTQIAEQEDYLGQKLQESQKQCQEAQDYLANLLARANLHKACCQPRCHSFFHPFVSNMLAGLIAASMRAVQEAAGNTKSQTDSNAKVVASMRDSQELAIQDGLQHPINSTPEFPEELEELFPPDAFNGVSKLLVACSHEQLSQYALALHQLRCLLMKQGSISGIKYHFHQAVPQQQLGPL